MRCDEVRRLLSERLDTPLPAEQAALLRAHLATCRECRAFDHMLVGGMTGIGMLPKAQPSDRVRQEVFRYVLLDNADPSRLGGRAWLRQIAGFSAASIVVVALAALLIVVLNHQANLPQTARPPAPSVAAQGAASSPSAKPTAKRPTPRATATPRVSTFAATPTPVPSGTAAPTLTANQASDVVERFYAAINARDYATAFDLYSDAMRAASGQALDSFSDGYRDTVHDSLTIAEVRPATTPDQWSVEIRLAATQADGSIRRYSGSYDVGLVDGAARIVAANVTWDNQPTPTPVATPTGTAPSSPAALPSCDPSQVAPTISSRVDGGNVMLQIEVAGTNAPCHLDTDARLSITGANGQALAVLPNSLRVPLSFDLPAGGAGLNVVWSNWCGPAAPATATLTLGTKSVDTDAMNPPACTTPGGVSTLALPGASSWSGTIRAVSPSSRSLIIDSAGGVERMVGIDPETVITDASGKALTFASLREGASVAVVATPTPDGNAWLATVVRLQP